jgi:hypothetical protein
MRISPSSRIVVATFICATVILGASAGDAARAAAGPLSIEPMTLPLPEAAVQDQEAMVARRRYTTIDFDALPNPQSRGLFSRQPRTVPLQLFPNVSINAVFERFDPNADGVTWVGHVDGVPFSTVTLVYGRGLLAGSVALPDATFAIRPAPAELRRAGGLFGRELHVVMEIRQDGFPREADPIEVELPAADLAAAADTVMADTADVIDVMVVYTPLAQARAGGEAGIANLVNLGVAETNTSYASSGVHQRLRLVHHALVDYSEPSSFNTALTELRGGIGTLNGVPALRNAVGADLVMMLVHPQSPSACGIAFLMTTVSTAFAPNGYSVTDTDCVAGFTFAHELGHNMGARHDWYVDNGTTPFTYAHGYVNPALGQRWRTIMAYPDHCGAMGFSCTRLLRWANALQTRTPNCGPGFNCALLHYWRFPGPSMGVPGGTNTSCAESSVTANLCDADDSRALNNTALSVANFRQAVADRR